MSAVPGKWARPDVPKKGWTCTSTYDSCEEDDDYDLHRTCEMCESKAIRYVHVMEHPAFAEPLECGCICAGKMEGSIEAATAREKSARLRSRRRGHFPDRAGWKRSAKGNLYINIDEHNVVIARRADGFHVGAKPRDRDRRKWGSRTYPTERAAQIAAFDAVEWCDQQSHPRQV